MNSDRLENRISIKDKQLAKLRTLLATLARGNRFYTNKFRDAGTPSEISTLKDFQRTVPFTLKQEIVEDQRRYCSLWYQSHLSTGALQTLLPN